MQIITKKRKPPVVPIVSLIDILAILLIFFIATSTFRQPKLAVDIEPPSPRSLATRAVDDTRETLAISAENEIFLGADDRPLDPARLVETLRASRDAGVKLELKADEGADFGVIVIALDALKKAGYNKGDYPTVLRARDPDAVPDPAPSP